jgi:hypothetical protein
MTINFSPGAAIRLHLRHNVDRNSKEDPHRTAAKETTVMKTEEKQAAPISESAPIPLSAPQESDEPAGVAQAPKQPRPWHPSWIYAM